MKLVQKPKQLWKLPQFKSGGLIPKFQAGGTPTYFKQYGIDPNKFISMFNALRSRGASNQLAFEVTWQSLKEVPKSYYSFGSRFKDVNSWADNVMNHQLKRNIYKDAVNARNFQEYRKATYPYNRLPTYTNWLLEGRDQGKQFMNEYIKQNNLGKPIVMNNSGTENNLDEYYT